jgi:acetoacetyl-CoA synthase
MRAFMDFVCRTRGLELETYDELWSWSVRELEDFWAAVWEFFGLGDAGDYKTVLVDRVMPGARWFPGARVNFASFLLGRGDAASPAIVCTDESGVDRTTTWHELRIQVASVAHYLRERGIVHGDVVVGYLPNADEAVIAFLATASVGAIWAGVGLDYAAPAVIDRFAQLEPKVLIAADGYQFAGRDIDRRAELDVIRDGLPSLDHAIVVPRTAGHDLSEGWTPWQDIVGSDCEYVADEVTFDHPLWVLFSSGTTGRPKGLVHGHGGIILESVKQFVLHWNLSADDRVFWFTSPSWVMWNLQVGTLVSGGSIICYDGSPTFPQAQALWSVAESTQATFVGLSPGYLQATSTAGVVPSRQFDLSHVRAMGSTGSPLSSALHEWATEAVGDVPLWSISGGTDVATAFVGGSPLVPVWAGEISVRCLGCAVEAWDADGNPVEGELGELVIRLPMPSMPIHFWVDRDGSRYRSAYFDTYPGTWRQGDWMSINGRGSLTITGRSDSTLNRNGVRMGSADIYAAVEILPGIDDSLVIGAEQPDGTYWMPLFIVLSEGHDLDDELRNSVRDSIRSHASPRHVPDEIIAVTGIPRTRTGKKLEVPIKRMMQGALAADALKVESVDRPELIAEFERIAAEFRARER